MCCFTLLANFDYSNLGKIIPLTKDDENTQVLQEMVGSPETKTSYNRDAVLHFLQHIKLYPNIDLVGFKLRAEDSSLGFENKIVAFAALERDSHKKLHIALFFTAPGERNKAWVSVLSRYVAEQNHDEQINFVPNSNLGTDWVEKFWQHMNSRAQSDPKEFFDKTGQIREDKEILYHQTRLVQGLSFSYENIAHQNNANDAGSIASFNDSHERREEIYASTRSPFDNPHRKPIVIIMTGPPAVGKNTVFTQLSSNFAWLSSFEILDIDKWAEKKIADYIARFGSLPQSAEEKEAILKTIYDQAWEKFVIERDRLIKEKKDFVLFVTGRQKDLVANYSDLCRNYRIVTFNISVSNQEILRERAKKREYITGRPIMEKFARECEEQIPKAQFAHNFIEDAPAVNIINDKKPLLISNITSHLCTDQKWREIVGEPTYWLNIFLTQKTRGRLDSDLHSIVFGMDH